MDSRGKLICPSREHAPYAETCSDGACGCAGIEGGDWKAPDLEEHGTEESS